MDCSQANSFSYSCGSKLVMPLLTPAALCSSHHSIILSYARAASSSWSKQPAHHNDERKNSCMRVRVTVCLVGDMGGQPTPSPRHAPWLALSQLDGTPRLCRQPLATAHGSRLT